MNATRRHILAVTAGAAALGALGGCEKIVSTLAEQFGESIPDAILPPDGTQIDPIHHLLNRAGFGPWPGDVQRVRAIGAEQWIDRQLHPESIDDDLCELRASRCSGVSGEPGESREFSKPHLRESLARHTLLRAVYSQRQLFEVMVGFWSDHLNINIEKADCIYHKPWDDRYVIRKHALGNFRDLIRASATSPAMLVYLDGNHNQRAKPSDIPNENYARELLELHTLGVHGGYTQHDVYETARALTGWRTRSKLFEATVHFDAREHDDGEKRILGHLIPALQKEKDVDDVADIVCSHPSTANHIATKLVRRFVSDDPPADLVKRVAQVFSSSDGDIKKTVRAVLTSDEFQAARGVKFKPPFRFVASALRALGADTHAHTPLIAYLTRMGQGVFQYPTPDGYPDKTSPWLGTLLWRWNLAFNLASNKTPSVDVHLDQLKSALGASGDSIAAKFFEHFNGLAPSEDHLSAMSEIGQDQANEIERSQAIAGLILASPAFQRY